MKQITSISTKRRKKRSQRRDCPHFLIFHWDPAAGPEWEVHRLDSQHLNHGEYRGERVGHLDAKLRLELVEETVKYFFYLKNNYYLIPILIFTFPTMKLTVQLSNKALKKRAGIFVMHCH